MPPLVAMVSRNPSMVSVRLLPMWIDDWLPAVTTLPMRKAPCATALSRMQLAVGIALMIVVPFPTASGPADVGLELGEGAIAAGWAVVFDPPVSGRIRNRELDPLSWSQSPIEGDQIDEAVGGAVVRPDDPRSHHLSFATRSGKQSHFVDCREVPTPT